MSRQRIFVAILSVVLVVLVGLKAHREGFFGSPGTYVQLATSHVPTEEDVTEARNRWRIINRDLINMTGSGL
jgi:hypothetical protein